MQMKTLAEERVVGFNIARLLKEKNITKESLAEMIPCSLSHLQAVLTGSISVREEEIEDIAQRLDVDADEIMREPGDDIADYNIHYMGKVSDLRATGEILDEIDLYVRLLNRKPNE